MTQAEKRNYVKFLAGNDPLCDEYTADNYLTSAKQSLMCRLYPFGWTEDNALPAIYDMTQCELAARLFARAGAEGEVIHIENGVHRNYASVNDEDLLSRVVPYAFVSGV